MGRWRAGSRYAENSIPAFQAALRAGADGVELDIHLAADDELIVHHDYRLGRASEGNRIRNTQLVCDLPSQREHASALPRWIDTIGQEDDEQVSRGSIHIDVPVNPV